jgi:hypothetical protein
LFVSVTETLSQSVDSLLVGVRSTSVFRIVPELSREVNVETGEISDGIVRLLSSLPGDWSDAVDGGDADSKD